MVTVSRQSCRVPSSANGRQPVGGYGPVSVAWFPLVEVGWPAPPPPPSACVVARASRTPQTAPAGLCWACGRQPAESGPARSPT